jgi:hypothetical protein
LAIDAAKRKLGEIPASLFIPKPEYEFVDLTVNRLANNL